MIDYKALFKISYGLYIVSSGNKAKGNGFISNTVFQVTSEPAQFATCCNKENHTCQLIEETGSYAVSVLKQDAEAGLIGLFGYRSGQDIDKLESADVKYGETGSPIILNDAIAVMECKVVKQIDLGTHIMFIGELVSAELIDEQADPLTYAFYREVKKGLAPKNAPTYVDKSKLESGPEEKQKPVHKCAACGYLYDSNKEEEDFEDLPDDWTCPICGAEKEDFMEI